MNKVKIRRVHIIFTLVIGVFLISIFSCKTNAKNIHNPSYIINNKDGVNSYLNNLFYNQNIDYFSHAINIKSFGNESILKLQSDINNTIEYEKSLNESSILEYSIFGITIILLLAFSIRNYLLRIKAEKDMEITKKDLQESYMELEATHEELVASEEELNRQFMELQEKEEALRTSRERYRLASKGAEVGMWDWDFSLNGIYLSTKAKEIVGLENIEGFIPLKSVLNKILKLDREHFINTYNKHYEGDIDIFQVKCRMEIKEGKYSWVNIRGKIEFNSEGKAIRIAGSINNINKEKLIEAKIEKLAYYDELTKLPNKAYYDKTILQYKNKYEKIAILCIDLDNFKCVNDCLGYEYGDSILKKIVQILRDTTKKEDKLIRFGGDEFIIITKDFNSEKDVIDYADKIIHKFGNTVEIEGFGFTITLSIGISIYSSDNNNVEALLKQADMALNEAKENGKNRYEIYSIELNENITNKHKLESYLRHAILNDEFELHYQPKYNLKDNKIVGYEALIRWNHPERGMISPKEFIPLAEEIGLIMPIGEWVIKEAISQLSNWNYMGYEDISVSINLSAKQFKDVNLINLFKEVVQDRNVNPENIVLEITESTALYDMYYATKVLDELREIGFRIALDDFGTGYSSLNYLNSLPIDILKIDKSFIDSIIYKKEGEQIIKAVISLAHAYNMEVIAEGVETLEQLEFLREENCDTIQGYYISSPKVNEEAIILIDERRKCS